jgi:CheY-like chemotaxis protein
MAPEVQRRIFEPFFTTKPLGKGTGLGLSAVDRAIKENDGEIEIVSNVGQGTVFKLMFPIVSQAPISRDEAPAATDLESSDDRIIVLVEEDPHIRAATKRILTSAGYNALECRSALRAIELCGGLKDQIGLIIADVSLPDGFSGMELAAELRRTRPALRVLFTTGNPLQLPAENENTETVTKPCKPEKLLSAVKKLLGDEPYPASHARQTASVSREPVSLRGN